MRCTGCSAIVTPIVAVDIDGTLAQYHSHFLTFAEGYFGRALRRDWDGRGDWEDYLGLTRREYEDMKLAFRQGGMKRTMPAFPQAREAMRCLEQMAEIWITTTRPYNRLDSVDPDTQEWLRRNGIRYDHMLYDEHKYQKLAELVDSDRVVAVIDDLPEQIEEAYLTYGNRVPILINGPHNQHSVWPRRADCLEDAVKMAAKNVRSFNNGTW